MRINAIVVLVLASVTWSSAQNSDGVIPRTILKTSPQHFVINALKLGVERFNASHTKSLAVFITARIQGDDNEFDGYNGLAGELQYRKYISPMKAYFTGKNKKFYRGIYAAGFVQGGAYSGEFKQTSMWYPHLDYDYSEKVSNWAVGFSIGYHRTIWEVIFIDAYLGGGVQWCESVLSGPQIPDFARYDTIVDPDYKGIAPKAGVQIGIAL